MRTIKNHKWKEKAKGPDGKSVEVESDLVNAIINLIAGMNEERIPRGISKFRMFNGLKKALEKAKKSGELILDELQYKFVRELIENEVPAIWAGNEDITNAIEAFLEAPVKTESQLKDGGE